MEATTKIKQKFIKPFIVYRIESEVSYETSKKLCKTLFTTYGVEMIYVEKIEAINSSNVFEEEALKEKYKDKIIQFDLETQQSDLCIILGGDGTCLWAKNRYQTKKIPPFLTFNLGNLGFFSFYDIAHYEDVLDELLLKQNYSLEKRQLLLCNIYTGKEPNEKVTKKTLFCLNDIVFDKGAGRKMLKLDLKVNQEKFATILSDGLLFSTPSGSSGYNLSCNGPLVNYKVPCYIMNALSPFTLSWRPIVFPQEFQIRVQNMSGEQMECTADGSIRLTMTDNDYAEITISDNFITFFHLKKYIKSGYFAWKQKLTGSLGWNILPGQNNFEKN